MAKKSKRTSSKSKNTKKKDEGVIKEASIAKFMRKRTQLVGFDYGLYKHTQYAVEFVDNALDAIEKFQWDKRNALVLMKKELTRARSKSRKIKNDVNTLKDILENRDSMRGTTRRLNQAIDNTLTVFKKIGNLQKELRDEYPPNLDIPFNRNIDLIIKRLKEIDVSSKTFDEDFDKFMGYFHKSQEYQDELRTILDEMSTNPDYMYTLDKEIPLENLSYLEAINGTESQEIDDKARADMKKLADYSSISSTTEQLQMEADVIADGEEDSDANKRARRKDKKNVEEKEKKVQVLIDNLNNFIKPVVNIIDNEPIVILKMQEHEAPQIYKEKGEKDAYLFTFEVYDNGTGMRPDDLLKFGKYLASSKSQKLRQTRGSQGFGAPSAFSDAQNTTGRPITVVSKHSTQPNGVVSQFYTTEENTKVYVVEPTEIDCKFQHGTYTRLQYLNKKYIRGYVDSYVEKTAMMNSHVTIIYIDPYGDEYVYPRRVDFFPREPKYALPHPSSIKIGDFQDLLRSSDNLTVTAFLNSNFVRLSNNMAKRIVNDAEFEIETKLKMLNVNCGFINIIEKEDGKLYFVREEQRIYGRSSKKRPKMILYGLEDQELLEKIWESMKAYNYSLKKRDEYGEQIEKHKNTIQKIQGRRNRYSRKKSDRKKLKTAKKEIKKLNKDFNKEMKWMEKAKKDIESVMKKAELTNEIKSIKKVDKYVNKTEELLISETRPSELSRTQVEYLYMAFKNQNYMSPPTDTAIPVGEAALETAIIKQYGLTVTERIDYFGDPEDQIEQIEADLELEDDEKIELVDSILKKFNNDMILSEDIKIDNYTRYNQDLIPKVYEKLFYEMELTQTAGDDFVAAKTRKPTSGKGLAFVVEAVMAYSTKNIPSSKKASQVLARYVNRTPKLRDNSDCALWLGTQIVNWKNYKVPDTFDNGIPKGNIVLYINCSGPYTHLMFKSQSKNALAEDDVLLKEIKQCLEAIGRKLRKYMNKRATRKRRKKRSRVIEKNIEPFVESLYAIAKAHPSRYEKLEKKELVEKIEEALAIDTDGAKRLMVTKSSSKKKSSKQASKKKSSKQASKKKSSKKASKKKPLKEKSKPSAKKKDAKQQTLEGASKKKAKKSKSKGKSKVKKYKLSKEALIKILESAGKWMPTKLIANYVIISDEKDVRYLKLLLKSLAREKKIQAGKKGKSIVWRIKD